MLAGWLVCYLLVAVKNIGIVRRFNSSPIPTFVSVRNGAFPRDWLNLSEHCDHLSVVLRAACVSVCVCILILIIESGVLQYVERFVGLSMSTLF